MIENVDNTKDLRALKIKPELAVALPKLREHAQVIKRGSVLEHKLVAHARECAHQEFANIKRKLPKGLISTAQPYVMHLEQVAQILASFNFAPEVVAAAYLHDHLEDLQKRGWNLKRLKIEFGAPVAKLVDWVTQQDKSLAWTERQQRYLKRLESAPSEAISLSLADKLSNTESLIFWMQRGYPVESIISKGWKENSDKLHELRDVYKNKVPAGLMSLYDRTLRQFDRLGKSYSCERRQAKEIVSVNNLSLQEFIKTPDWKSIISGLYKSGKYIKLTESDSTFGKCSVWYIDYRGLMRSDEHHGISLLYKRDTATIESSASTKEVLQALYDYEADAIEACGGVVRLILDRYTKLNQESLH